MKKIVYVTNFEELPKSCLECKNPCALPLNTRRVEAVVNKPYWNKRHKDCPLLEIEIDVEAAQ